MKVGEVLKGIRWSAEAGGPPKVRIGGVSGRGRGPTIKGAFYCAPSAIIKNKIVKFLKNCGTFAIKKS